MEVNDFWQDADRAQLVINESNELKAWTVPYSDLKKRFEDVQSLLPEAYEAEEDALVQELLNDLNHVDVSLADLEVRRMLSGELDSKDCYLTINSGAGGTEACDWAQNLSRM